VDSVRAQSALVAGGWPGCSQCRRKLESRSSSRAEAAGLRSQSDRKECEKVPNRSISRRLPIALPKPTAPQPKNLALGAGRTGEVGQPASPAVQLHRALIRAARSTGCRRETSLLALACTALSMRQRAVENGSVSATYRALSAISPCTHRRRRFRAPVRCVGTTDANRRARGAGDERRRHDAREPEANFENGAVLAGASVDEDETIIKSNAKSVGQQVVITPGRT